MNVTDNSNNDFRKLKIHPTVDDITRQSPPDLSPNLINQSYDNTDHYLRTQFGLLREESVGPLVEDINKLKILLTEEKTTNVQKVVAKDHKMVFKDKVEKEIDRSNVFFDVRLTDPHFELINSQGVVLRFTFDYSSIENIDLVDCQHLMDGGLLCLSSDNFNNSIVFGVIVNSKLRTHEEGSHQRSWVFSLKVDLDTNGSKEFFDFISKPNQRYIGVESPSYFEGFRHTLNSLQTIFGDFPFKRYISDIKTDIKSAKYLSDDTVYDISCIKRKETEESNQNSNPEQNTNPLSSVRILNNDVFGNFGVYNKGVASLKKLSTFDTKQFDAFYTALTKELTVIEGPPGTGKTFVGLKIVESLLKNKDVLNKEEVENQSSNIRPILIVCYKNHALDQFLEGIIKFNQKVVRIGGKSESKALEDYKLGTIEFKFSEQMKVEKHHKITAEEDLPNMTIPKKALDPKLVSEKRKINKILNKIHGIYGSIDRMIKKDFDGIRNSFEVILDFQTLKPYIKPNSVANVLETSWESLDSWIDTDPKVCRKRLHKKRLTVKELERNDNFIQPNKNNILELSSDQKWLLYLYWRELYLNDFQKQLNQMFQTIAKEIKELDKKRNHFRRMLCKDAEVIGLTVTGAAKYKDLVRRFNPRIMIVEEAAEVLEGHVVAALPPNIEHLILIGDHKQLQPLTNVHELSDKYFLHISLFERLVKNKLPFVQLELQHRMRPCISELLKVAKIYDNLRNGDRVQSYPNIEYTFKKNMYFVDHQNIEDSNFCRDVCDKSRSNLYEAKFVVELVKYFLLRQYPPEKMSVLATYNAQLSLIKRLMFQQKGLFVRKFIKENPLRKTANKRINGLNIETAQDMDDVDNEEEELTVRVSSVDGFQGEENDIIILSFVRSSKIDSIGFLGVMNRVNVALSRAKHALFCVGNFTIMAKESKRWKAIVEHLSENNCFGEVLTIGCNCTQEMRISMPGQLELLNLQLTNGRCSCSP